MMGLRSRRLPRLVVWASSVAIAAGIAAPAPADEILPLPVAGAAGEAAPGPALLANSETRPPSQNSFSDAYEVRGGILYDFILHEESFAANGDFVFRKFWTTDSLWDFAIPRVHVGGMGNLDGKTSYAFAGLLWTFNFTDRIFGEISFGGAVHNGYLTDPPPGRDALGCRVEYNPGASLGMHLTPQWNVMVTFDHVSNGKGTLSSCPANEGLNELGLRFGYAF